MTMIKYESIYIDVQVMLLQDAKANKPGMRENLVEAGFTYYFILARFYDIDRKLHTEGNYFISQ